MNGDRANATSSDSTDVVQRARPLHGRTSGPTRRSTKGQWTTEEDEILRQAVHRFKGKNWKKIAECFKERTDVQCLHRWQKVLNPELVKGPWSKEEDEIIIQMVNRYGPKKWSTIAQALPGRIGKQCRERWHNHLNPSINKEAWTQEEELALIRAHQIYGNKWAELMKFLPGRTDNAIKNHWNSSVKKKLDQYLASGLLQQFQGLPHATLPSQSNASSCRVQHISEDDTVLHNGSEMEEVTQCSQGSTFIGSQSTSDMGSGILLMRDESTLAEECNVFDPGFCSMSRSESHPLDTQAVSLLITEVPHGVGGLTFNDNGSMHDWDSAVVNNWQISPEELSNMLSQDLGQFVQHLNGNNSQQTLPSPLQHSITNMVAGGFPSNRDICGVEQSVDPILQPSNYLVSEESTFASNSCYSLGSDMFTTLYAQEHSVPVEHHLTDVNDFSEENQEHSVPLEHHLTDVNDFSEENQEHDSVPHRYEGLIHVNESSNSPCREVTGQMQQGDDPPKVVDINHLGSASSHNVQTSVGKDLVVRDEHKDSRNLYYEPPRFPFLCCDLIPSGSDTLQEFSPLGTRQFWTSVNRFWDSPTGERSPDAVLKSAAKSYLCTPSILKKRNRDLVSPLSEKRMEKKFERDLNREQFSKLSSEFSRLDVMLDEIDKSSKDIERTVDIIEDKENRVPDTGQGERTEVNFIKGTTSAEARLPLTEVVAEISKNDGEGTDADVSNSDGGSKNYAIKCKVDDANCSKDADRDGASAEIASGLDHEVNSCLLSSPERFGIKRLEAATAVTSTSEATSASMISPGMCKMKDGCNLVMSQVRPSEIASMFGETPIRRNIESPSAWKSPWFISPFLLGSRVDTDISIEDYGLFASPKDKTFDAISLMKQLSEQTASAFANAQQVLGDETPETILKKKFSSKLKQGYRENNEIEHRDLEQQASHSSSIPSERRILDFSNCGTPEKEPSKNGKFSQAMFNSPPSYLLKNCR